MGMLDGWTREDIQDYMQARKDRVTNPKPISFNPFTTDPNCKTCGKNRKAK